MDETNEPQSGYLLPDKAYEILKWVSLIALPAIAVFAQTVGPAWGLPHVDQIVATIDALGVLIGALIGVSEIKARLTA